MTDAAAGQAGFVRSHLEATGRPMTPGTARRLAILATDTYAIARHARARAVGAGAADTALAAGAGAAPVWGADVSQGAALAAFLNGSAAETLDFQEVLIDGRNNGHAAVVIVPAVLALAAAHGARHDRILVALRAGFLANIALARALGRNHRAGVVGFRTTSVVAPIAAAFAGAVLLDLSEAATNHAVAITAATLPAGLLAAMSPLAGDFSSDKDLSVGFSARHACDAVTLARAGATGPSDALAGPRGWLASFGFGGEAPGALAELPDDAALAAYALKLYPANFGCQCAIRLAIEASVAVPLEDLSHMTVRVKSSSAASLSTRDISNHIAARFSLPYAVASAFLRRRSVLEDFEPEALSAPDVHAVMDRLTLEADDSFEARHVSEGVFPAALTVKRHDGSEVSWALSSPQDGMSGEDLTAAFAGKLHSLLPAPIAADLVARLEDEDYAALLSALR
ncbi:MmgE/PrpD family protein [Pseudaestuariivita sp.]|uniref:MmgE/PrpD family protein n=1 Tax=Pseudaestuariivita sp. TaxID=2211669 RepID=UPI004059EF2E